MGSQQVQSTTSNSARSTSHSTTNNSQADLDPREQILNSLLQVELSEAIRNYLTRTRRSFPIHYVFDMSDLESLFTRPQS